MKKSFKILNKEFTKGAMFMVAIFLISMIVFGAYAFVEPGMLNGPDDGNNFIHPNSPLLKVLVKLDLINNSFYTKLDNVTKEIYIIKSLLNNTDSDVGSDCVDEGGVVFAVPGTKICKFSGASCPSVEWIQYSDYTETTSNTCTGGVSSCDRDGEDWHCTDSSYVSTCITPEHIFSNDNTIEDCTYKWAGNTCGGPGCSPCSCVQRYDTCYATVSAMGCVKADGSGIGEKTPVSSSLPDCNVGEAIVKTATGWECKSESLFGKEKMDLSAYTSDMTITGFNSDISNISDADSNTNISVETAAGNMFGSHSCGFNYPGAFSDNPGIVEIDFGPDYASKFGIYILSGEIDIIGGHEFRYKDDHVPGVYCNIGTVTGGMTSAVYVYSSVDGVNWVNQGGVGATAYGTRKNTFAISGSVSGRYIKIQTARGISSGVKSYGVAKYNLNNLEIYYNTF